MVMILGAWTMQEEHGLPGNRAKMGIPYMVCATRRTSQNETGRILHLKRSLQSLSVSEDDVIKKLISSSPQHDGEGACISHWAGTRNIALIRYFGYSRPTHMRRRHAQLDNWASTPPPLPFPGFQQHKAEMIVCADQGTYHRSNPADKVVCLTRTFHRTIWTACIPLLYADNS